MNDNQRRQRRIMDYYRSRPDNPPTIREIMAACDISSTSVVAYHLDRLIEAGLLVSSGGLGQARKIRLPSDAAHLRLRVRFLEAKVRELERKLGEA